MRRRGRDRYRKSEVKVFANTKPFEERDAPLSVDSDDKVRAALIGTMCRHGVCWRDCNFCSVVPR